MSQDQKKNLIIEAAQKRFAHFGVGKTTMNEIAEDLSLSKASLYYYFPDKLNLYAAVLQKIIETEELNKEVYAKETDPLAALNLYLEHRTQFIIQHYNILEYLKTLGTGIPAELEPIFSSARGREITAIAEIFEKGTAAKKLVISDAASLAALFFDALDGVRLSVIARKTNFFPDKEQFYELGLREKELARIFLRGLASQAFLSLLFLLVS
ncbi:MAG: TetR family transcriptional regulator [Bacteroidota bacterium]